VAATDLSFSQAGLGWIEARIFGSEPPRQAEVQNLDQAAVGQHHVLRLQIAMKDAQRVRRLQAVGNLDAHRKHSCRLAGPRAISLSSGWPGTNCMAM
jgi:hypothetical protein